MTHHHPAVITAIYEESAGFKPVKEVKLQLQVRGRHEAGLEYIIIIVT